MRFVLILALCLVGCAMPTTVSVPDCRDAIQAYESVGCIGLQDLQEPVRAYLMWCPAEQEARVTERFTPSPLVWDSIREPCASEERGDCCQPGTTWKVQ